MQRFIGKANGRATPPLRTAEPQLMAPGRNMLPGSNQEQPMSISPSMISFPPGEGYVPTTPHPDTRQRDGSEISASKPARFISGEIVEFNFDLVQAGPGREQTSDSTAPNKVSVPTTEEMSKLHYLATAKAISRLLALGTISKIVLLFGVAWLMTGLSQGWAAETLPCEQVQMRAEHLGNFTGHVGCSEEVFPNVQSDGPDRGGTFTLELPLNPAAGTVQLTA